MLLGLTLTVQAQNKQKFAGYLFAYFEGSGVTALARAAAYATRTSCAARTGATTSWRQTCIPTTRSRDGAQIRALCC